MEFINECIKRLYGADRAAVFAHKWEKWRWRVFTVLGENHCNHLWQHQFPFSILWGKSKHSHCSWLHSFGFYQIAPCRSRPNLGHPLFVITSAPATDWTAQFGAIHLMDIWRVSFDVTSPFFGRTCTCRYAYGGFRFWTGHEAKSGLVSPWVVCLASFGIRVY